MSKVFQYHIITGKTTDKFSLSYANGLHPFLVPDALDREQQHKKIIQSLPPRTYWEHRIHKLVTNAVATLATSISSEDNPECRELRLLMDVFDNEVLEVESRAHQDLGTWNFLNVDRLDS